MCENKCASCKNGCCTCQTTPPTKTVVVPVPGLSAYELWLSIGNTGTLQDYLNSLESEVVWNENDWN